MIITLPWPHKDLKPNGQHGHWATKANARKKAREIGHYAALEAAGSQMRAIRASLAGDGKIAVTMRFYPPDRRHRDDDNMIASVKAFRDGIADALEVNDRRFRPHYFFEDACKPGRVEVQIDGAHFGEKFLPNVGLEPLKGGSDQCANTKSEPDHERTGDAP